MAEDKDFRVFLQNKKIPVCVLDQKWHRLFAIKGKPENVAACEQELNELLKKQGHLNNEIRELRKLKAKLMGNIVENMEGTHQENAGRTSSKKLDEDKRLIDDINEKLETHADELLEIPREIDRVNKGKTQLLKSLSEFLVLEFPLWLSMLRIQHGIHKDTGLIPGLSQWVKDLVFP